MRERERERERDLFKMRAALCCFRASVLVLSMVRCVFAGHVSCRPRHVPRSRPPGTVAAPLLA